MPEQCPAMAGGASIEEWTVRGLGSCGINLEPYLQVAAPLMMQLNLCNLSHSLSRPDKKTHKLCAFLWSVYFRQDKALFPQSSLKSHQQWGLTDLALVVCEKRSVSSEISVCLMSAAAAIGCA